MDEEYDVIVLGTGLKVKFIYTNIASHDNKDLMTSILNKFHFWWILMKKIIETGQPFTVNIFRKCYPVIVTDAEVVCHVNKYHSWFCICFDIEGGVSCLRQRCQNAPLSIDQSLIFTILVPVIVRMSTSAWTPLSHYYRGLVTSNCHGELSDRPSQN